MGRKGEKNLLSYGGFSPARRNGKMRSKRGERGKKRSVSAAFGPHRARSDGIHPPSKKKKRKRGSHNSVRQIKAMHLLLSILLLFHVSDDHSADRDGVGEGVYEKKEKGKEREGEKNAVGR